MLKERARLNAFWWCVEGGKLFDTQAAERLVALLVVGHVGGSEKACSRGPMVGERCWIDGDRARLCMWTADLSTGKW